MSDSTPSSAQRPVSLDRTLPLVRRTPPAFYIIVSLAVLVAAYIMFWPRPDAVRIGAKGFTENIILGEAVDLLAEEYGYDREFALREGGSGVAFRKLVTGDIDIYPDYTGTLIQSQLASRNLSTVAELEAALDEQGLAITEPIGFNNTYTIVVRTETARQLGLKTISDLRDHPQLVSGVSNEFLERDDGWRNMAAAYGLSNEVRGMQHELAYQALIDGSIDITDAYSTDAQLAKFDFTLLEDDRSYFPAYEAVFVYRQDLANSAPKLVEALRQFAGAMDEARMMQINAITDVDGDSERQAAAAMLHEIGLRDSPQLAAQQLTMWDRLWVSTGQHLQMVLVSMVMAMLVAVPLGVLAAKAPRAIGQGILGTVGVMQTVPALALLALMVQPFAGSAAAVPAIVALFLYSLLPIARNTYTGLHDVPPELKESATVLGFSPVARLTKLELPLAARSILGGIKTSAVINVGTATLGTLIGAGGYGDVIMAGIRQIDVRLVLQGLIPAAVMALVLQWLLDLLELAVVSPGLRQAVRR